MAAECSLYNQEHDMNRFHIARQTLIGVCLIFPVTGFAAQTLSPPGLDDYRVYRHQPTENWAHSNRMVSEIGGWRAYLQEGGGMHHHGHHGHTMPATTDSPTTQGGHHEHAGH
jgi:hypothetical protein